MRHLPLIILFVLLMIGVASATTFTTNVSDTTRDAQLARSVDNSSFTALRNGAGTSIINTSNTYTSIAKISNSEFTSNSNYTTITRGAYSLDTSALPNDAVISSAVLSIWGYSKASQLGIVNLSLTGFTPVSETNLQATDYNRYNDTRLATDIPYASIPTAGWINFTLNAAGIANVSLTGNTLLMVRIDKDVDNSSSGLATTYTDSGSYVRSYDTSYTGAANDPFITVEYTVPTPTPTPTPTVTPTPTPAPANAPVAHFQMSVYNPLVPPTPTPTPIPPLTTQPTPTPTPTPVVTIYGSPDTLYVSDWGVTGSGDETSEVQAAVNYAYSNHMENVIFPAGVNITVGQLRFKSGLTMVGNGSTLFLKANSHTGTSPWPWIFAEPNVDISGFTFNGNRNATGNGLNTNGVMLQGGNLFENNNVTSINSYAVYMYGSAPSNIIVRNNTISDIKQYGIETGCSDGSYCYTNNAHVTNNTISTSHEVGIKIRGTTNALIDNNTITVGSRNTVPSLGDTPTGIRLYSEDERNSNVTILNNVVTGLDEDPSVCIKADDNEANEPNTLIGIGSNTVSHCHTGIQVYFNDGAIINNTITSCTHKCVDGGSGNDWNGTVCS